MDKILQQVYNYEEIEDNLAYETIKLKYIMGVIEDLLSKHNLEAVDSILKDADVSKISTQVLIGIIRTTFRIRDLVENWYNLRRRIHTEIYTRGENPDRLMRGLYN